MRNPSRPGHPTRPHTLRPGLPLAVLALGLAWLGALSVAQTSADPASSKRIPIEDFESYASDAEVAKAWYKPPHGASVRQSLDPDNKGGGKQGLRIAYSTTREPATHYAPFCRVARWDLSGCNAAQFWLKPDGSGRQLTVEFNMASKEGKNIHDLWGLKLTLPKGETQPRIVTVPFAKLVHNTRYANSPNTSPVFNPGAVIEIAFYIGGRDDTPGEGVYVFDDLAGIHDPALNSP